MKRFFAWILCFALIFSCCPALSVQAEEEGIFVYELYDGEAIIIGCLDESVEELVIPATLGGCPVTRIESGAFYSCTEVVSVSFPASMTEIWPEVFWNCSKITAFFVDENNPQYSTDSQGVLFNKDKTTLVMVPKAWEGRYTVPNGVTAIGENALRCCGKLETVILPEGLVSIGQGAFSECYELRTIDIPESVTHIGAEAFIYGSLQKIFIPAGVETIGEKAFFGCGMADGFRVAAQNPNYSSDEQGILYNKDKTRLIQAGEDLPACVIPETVTVIGQGAFCYTGLREIVIPDAVTTLEEEAFWNCYLQDVTIGKGLKEIADDTFGYCYDLNTFTVSEENTAFLSDEVGALYSKDKTVLYRIPCKASSYTIPETVTQIAPYAGMGCGRLTSIVVPEGVTRLDEAFAYSLNLKAVQLPTTLQWCNYSFDSCENLTDIYFMGTQEQWEQVVFWDEESLMERVNIHFGEPMPEIPLLPEEEYPEEPDEPGGDYYPEDYLHEGMFYYYVEEDAAVLVGCDAELAVGDITVPETLGGYPLTAFGSEAFSDCAQITTITIPASVSTIHSWAFDNCLSLTGIFVDPESPHFSNDDRGVLFNKEKTYLHRAPSGIAGSYDIPETVKTLGDSAFYGCRYLEKVNIPEGVEVLNNYAFGNCGLTEIYIPASVEFIGMWALNGDNLTGIFVDEDNGNYSSDQRGVLFDKAKHSLIQAPGALSGGYAIPETVAIIEPEAFFYSKVQMVAIPVSVSRIGEYAFSDSELQHVYYAGTQEQWERVEIDVGNGPLENATMHFGETMPDTLPVPPAGATTPGNLDGNNVVNEDDAIYLLQAILMPELFPVEQFVDYDGNGIVNEDDAIYLLQHVLMPEMFPLNVPGGTLRIFNNLWDAIPEENRFPAVGGDMENMVQNAPGLFAIDPEELSANFQIPAQYIENVREAATLAHSMQLEMFAGAVIQVSSNAEEFAEAVHRQILQNEWVERIPERLLIAVIDDEYVFACFGVTQAVEPFDAAIYTAYPGARVLYYEGLAQ